MRLIKIALSSVNATVGSVRSNTDRCRRMAGEMAAAGVTVGAFPEQVIGGYPAEDLVQWGGFVAAQWDQLRRFASGTSGAGTVWVLGLVVARGGHLYNAAAVVHRGRVVGEVPKEKLPTYNVFHEARTFSRGAPGQLVDLGGVPLGDLVFAFAFGTLAVELCEDVWSPDGPMRRRATARPRSRARWRAGRACRRPRPPPGREAPVGGGDYGSAPGCALGSVLRGSPGPASRRGTQRDEPPP